MTGQRTHATGRSQGHPPVCNDCGQPASHLNQDGICQDCAMTKAKRLHEAAERLEQTTAGLEDMDAEDIVEELEADEG